MRRRYTPAREKPKGLSLCSPLTLSLLRRPPPAPRQRVQKLCAQAALVTAVAFYGWREGCRSTHLRVVVGASVRGERRERHARPWRWNLRTKRGGADKYLRGARILGFRTGRGNPRPGILGGKRGKRGNSYREKKEKRGNQIRRWERWKSKGEEVRSETGFHLRVFHRSPTFIFLDGSKRISPARRNGIYLLVCSGDPVRSAVRKVIINSSLDGRF